MKSNCCNQWHIELPISVRHQVPQPTEPSATAAYSAAARSHGTAALLERHQRRRASSCILLTNESFVTNDSLDCGGPDPRAMNGPVTYFDAMTATLSLRNIRWIAALLVG
jgi:hypothetical protein